MSHELPRHFVDENILIRGDVTVLINDPVGLGRVVSSKEVTRLLIDDSDETGIVRDGEVTYYPADGDSPRTIVGMLGYMPRRQVGSAKADMTQIHAQLLRSEVTRPTDIVAIERDESGSGGLAISVGTSGIGARLYVGSRGREQYATGHARVELELPFFPEIRQDTELTSELIALWGIARHALDTPRHRRGRTCTSTIVLGGMTPEETIRDTWKVIADYDLVRRNSAEQLPELLLNMHDTELLEAAYGIDADSLMRAIDHLTERHLLKSDVGSMPTPMTIYDLAEYFDSTES